MLQEAGQFLWKNMVWDSEASLASNLAWGALMVGSLAAAPLSGGTSVAGAVAARTAARAGVRAAVSSATKTATRTATKAAASSADDVAKVAVNSADDAVKAAAKATAHNADDVAKAGTKATATTAARTTDDAANPGFWKGAMTRRTAFAVAATPVAIEMAAGIIEIESGGKLSRAALETSVSTINAGIESGAITYENLENSINATAYSFEVMNAIDKSVQNGVVLSAMGTLSDTPTEEQIERGRQATVGWLLSPQNLPILAGKNLLRASIIDEVIDDKDQADKYLAEQFINDIHEKSQVEALGEHQVTEDDIKTNLAHTLQSPLARKMFPDRLQNGLKQLYPEMFAEAELIAEQTQQAATRNNPLGSFAEADIDALNGRSLSNMFSQATDMATDMNMDLGWQFNIYTAAVGFLSAINIFGWADDLIEGLQRHAIDMVQDEVVNQGENFFGVTDTREFEQENAPRPTPTGPQPAAAM